MVRSMLFLVLTLFGPAQLDFSRNVDWNLPDEARHRLRASKFFDFYKLSEEVNPFYLRGDFDGDGKPDYAILVAAIGTRKRYILVCRSGTTNLEILTGLNTSVVFDPQKTVSSKEDFNWMDAWQVTERRELESNELNETRPLPMRGEGIVAEKTEAASVIIYWTGKGYYWYQAGD